MSEPAKNEAIAAIRHLRREIDARTRTGDFQDDSDIFDLDRRVMEAELRWPRSTLALYFEWYRPAWLVGAVLATIGIVALALIDNAAVGWVAIGLGVLLVLGPVAAWYQSRPRVADRGDAR
jgi:hypothetical protein